MAKARAGLRRMRVAVIGAGVAGLACARALQSRGALVEVFEREPRPGGRLGLPDGELGGHDCGAQFLTPESPEFARELRGWVDADVVRTWDARIVRLVGGGLEVLPAGGLRLVGIPHMRSIGQHLAQGLDVSCGVEVAHLVRTPSGWLLFDRANQPQGSNIFDVVALAVPAPIARVIAGDASDVARRIDGTGWNANWVASLQLTRPSGIDFDAAFIDDDPILAWAARENSKPGREMGEGVAERWMLHARSSWSNAFATLEQAEAGRWMHRAFAARVARPLAQRSCVATCWRLATPAGCQPDRFLWDPAERIGFAGDWLNAPHIEGAWESGRALAAAITAPEPDAPGKPS